MFSLCLHCIFTTSLFLSLLNLYCMFIVSFTASSLIRTPLPVHLCCIFTKSLMLSRYIVTTSSLHLHCIIHRCYIFTISFTLFSYCPRSAIYGAISLATHYKQKPISSKISTSCGNSYILQINRMNCSCLVCNNDFLVFTNRDLSPPGKIGAGSVEFVAEIDNFRLRPFLLRWYAPHVRVT